MSPRLPWWAVWLPPVLSAYSATVLIGAGARFDLLAWALLVVGALAALVPWLISRGEDGQDDGAGLLAALAGVTSLHAIAIATPARSLLLELSSAALPAAAGALLVWLALRTPTPPRPIARLGALGVLVSVLAAIAAAVGAAVVLAPFEAFGETMVLPGALLDLPVGVLVGGALAAAALRLVAGRLGSGPTELARSSFAVLGTVVGLVALVAAGALSRGLGADDDVLRLGWLLAHVGFLLGHVALSQGARLFDPGRAAAVTREALAVLVTCGMIALTVLRARAALEHMGAITIAFGALALFACALAVHRLARGATTFLLAPDRGRLLSAIGEAREAMVASRSLDELGQRVLAPLARATVSGAAGPVLLVVAPALEIGVDAAGQPHVRATEHSPALLARLTERPGEVLLRAPLEALVVRRPELRPLTQALERMDALAVVALVSLGELEGALVVARGQRKEPVTLEEISALNELGVRLSGLLATLAAERRAQDRVGAAVLDARSKDERIEALEEQLAELRADAAALKAGAQLDRFSQPVIAYGPSMRAFVQRAEQVAPLDGPVLVRAEPGTALEPIGHLLHAGSPRRDGPLVVADALSLTEGRAMAALFGTTEGEPHPGWLKLAQGGTLLLLDVPALPLPVQSALEEAIASRSFRPVSGERGGSAQVLEVRVVMTARVDLAQLVATGSFDAELAKRVEPLTLVVPSLAARREDLRSLVLVAIDRGCRALGKPTVGIEEDALKALLDHPFSEGTRELESIVERAVGRARGVRITLADLELVAPTSTSAGTTPSEGDAWVGSYTELETRILEKALERAHGNKSEAARALGLKRTTFLDKLRRAGLERPTSPPPAPDPEA